MKVTSEELDNLELRLRLLANAAEAGSRPKRLARRAAAALRALSLSMNQDAECRGALGQFTALQAHDREVADTVKAAKS